MEEKLSQIHLPFSGAPLDPDDAGAAAGGEAEEDGLHQDAHRVRAHALRDAHGRHQIQEVMTENLSYSA